MKAIKLLYNLVFSLLSRFESKSKKTLYKFTKREVIDIEGDQPSPTWVFHSVWTLSRFPKIFKQMACNPLSLPSLIVYCAPMWKGKGVQNPTLGAND